MLGAGRVIASVLQPSLYLFLGKSRKEKRALGVA